MSSEQASEQPAVDRPQLTRMYAGALDDQMCPECARHAGHEYRRDDPEAPTIPNQSCSNPQGCRCSWL